MRVSPLFRTPSRFGPPSKNDISPTPVKIPADVDNFSSLHPRPRSLCPESPSPFARPIPLLPRTSPLTPDRMSTAKDIPPLRPGKSRSRSSTFGFRSCLRGEYPLFPLAPSPGKRPPALFAPGRPPISLPSNFTRPAGQKCCPDDRLCQTGRKAAKFPRSAHLQKKFG